MEPHTDPRAHGNGKIQSKDIPLFVGKARQEAGEVAILCEAIGKDVGTSREVKGAAHRLWQQSIRLGQVANALSAVPMGEALVWLPPRMSVYTRIKILLILGYRILKN